MTTRLPVLEELRIANPCNADWDDMTGDARVRFCGQCEKNVYNLSQMTRAEAETLVREKEGRLCVRFYQRSDGTVLTADCPVGVRKKRLRQRVWASVTGAAASLMLTLSLWTGRARADLTLRDGKQRIQPLPAMPVMGGASAHPVPSPRPIMMGEPMPIERPLMGKPSMPHVKMGDVAPQK